jgi:predicted membrane metal-binding protein
MLPLVLAAFAAGVVWLQWQPELPSASVWLCGAVVASALAIALQRFAAEPLVARIVVTILAALAAGALGFGYAGWRAEARLADALPSAWEGVDIALVGVVDDLPQSSARGTRFVLAVERTETPRATVPARLSLAWYAQVRKDGTNDEVPDIVAGERWRLTVRLKRPHGTVNPHGFDVEAWMLESGLRATVTSEAAIATRCSTRSPGAQRTTSRGARERVRGAHPRCACGRDLCGRDRRADDRGAARDSRVAMARVQSDRDRAPDQHFRACT